MRATLSLFFLTLLGALAVAVWGFLAGLLLRDLGAVGSLALAPATLALYLAVAGQHSRGSRARRGAGARATL